MRGIEKIIIHHSATEDGDTLSYPAIAHYHVEKLGWRDIGYHLVVELFEGQWIGMVGRPLDEIGAHAIGWNARSWGVCLVGNFDSVEPSADQLAVAARHVAGLVTIANLSVDAIIPHREVANYKSCPGQLFDMNMFRSLVKSKL